MKTNELTGIALDWAVAKCEPDGTLAIYFDEDTGEPLCHDDWEDNQEYKPSTNWSQGGPIIEREGINTRYDPDCNKAQAWEASDDIDFFEAVYGPTPLIAAMRCYVASVLGDDIEIPEGLT
jgi:hypothetical protein